jgi:hypothetical protein
VIRKAISLERCVLVFIIYLEEGDFPHTSLSEFQKPEVPNFSCLPVPVRVKRKHNETRQ